MKRRGLLAVAGSALVAGCSVLTGESDEDGPSTETDARDGPGAGHREPIRVDSRDGLLAALDSARDGDVVSVHPDAEIDLEGLWSLGIPAGVTLTGGRGVGGNGGALLYTTEGDHAPDRNDPEEKLVLERGARFTGFRLRGHHHDYVNPEEEHDGDYWAHADGGIRAGRGARVDNNEISGWTHTGVMATDDAHVHNNFIHHNTWEGLGYGVKVPRGDHMPIIEYNEFNYNRHSIACSGGPEPGYVARYNVVGEDWVGHQFDVHGTDGMTGIAGDEILIHNNTFRATRAVEAKTRNPGGKHPAIFVRGEPTTGVWVEQNWFYHDSREAAFKQPDGPRNAHFSHNHYGTSEPESPFVGVPEFPRGGPVAPSARRAVENVASRARGFASRRSPE